jgi:hypothetical protein
LTPRIRIAGTVTGDEGELVADYTGDNSLDLINELMVMSENDLRNMLDSIAQHLLLRKAGI